MGPINPSNKSDFHRYILVVIDYAIKWDEATPTKHDDKEVVAKFLKGNIFSSFGCSKDLVSDGGDHFCQ